MQRTRGTWSELPQGKCLQQVEHLKCADALAIRRQFVNRPVTISRGDRIDPLARVLGKILSGHRAAVPPRNLLEAPCNFPLVESVAPLRSDLPVRPGQVGIAKQSPDP